MFTVLHFPHFEVAEIIDVRLVFANKVSFANSIENVLVSGYQKRGHSENYQRDENKKYFFEQTQGEIFLGNV